MDVKKREQGKAAALGDCDSTSAGSSGCGPCLARRVVDLLDDAAHCQQKDGAPLHARQLLLEQQLHSKDDIPVHFSPS